MKESKKSVIKSIAFDKHQSALGSNRGEGYFKQILNSNFIPLIRLKRKTE